MDKEHRKVLTKNRVFIIENIVNPEDVVEKLYEKELFTKNMKQEVEAEKTTVEKVRKILDLIQKRGEKAFDGFYDSLVESDNGIVADKLKPELAEKRKAEMPTKPTVPRRQYGRDTAPIYQGNILPETWPDENIMKSPVEVIPCDTGSPLVRENWANDHVYSMRKKNRGRCFMISNKYFWSDTGFDDRQGTEMDEDRARELFRQLFFDVIIHKDKTAQEMELLLKAESQQQVHRDAEAFVCILLSHGTELGVCGIDGKALSVPRITEMFDSHHCEGLRHKPKLFFIQACQGESRDYGGQFGIRSPEDLTASIQKLNLDSADAQREEYPPVTSNVDLPSKVDILVASATHPGLVSLRNIMHGSWFIQAVIHVFMNFAHKEDIYGLLTLVFRLVARGRTPDADSKLDMMQSSMFNTSLQKKFYFFPGLAS